MLKIRQKIQISSEATVYDGDKFIFKAEHAGKIGYITKYLGKFIFKGRSEDYYLTSLTHIRCARSTLYPIDDEPCDAEFLEELFHDKHVLHS